MNLYMTNYRVKTEVQVKAEILPKGRDQFALITYENHLPKVSVNSDFRK